MGVASRLLLLLRQSRAACAVVASGALFSPLEAAALSCLDQGVTAPFRESSDIPTNTRIWCAVDLQPRPPGAIVLMDSAGAPVSGIQTELSLPTLQVLVFRPDSELDAESRYTYVCPHRDVVEFTFTTGAGPSTATPPVPDLSRPNAEAFTREDVGVNYVVSFAEAVEPNTIVVVDVGGQAALDASGPSGLLSDATESLYRVPVFVGRGFCLRSWPEATLGASTTVALGAFDVTGAFSGWSDPVTVTMPTTFDNEPDDVSNDGLDGMASTASGADELARTEASPSGSRGLVGCAVRSSPRNALGLVGMFVALTALAGRVVVRRRSQEVQAARGSLSCPTRCNAARPDATPGT